ncbi:hypothetical protein CDV36_008479 [Fusarium kuroshium]|uniref:Uncharacterized protein n=1 Tax=Fusarium kuroshium TaxID=2010991 RepID=A0A3M2S3H7_9HYPO|nr:hypothetical protein CDV36_008479 [Fusarium kuroshium]
MAANGKGGIENDYPPLDSWSQVDRHLFTHNTSGFTTRKLPSKATLCNAGQAEADGTVQEEGQNLDEEMMDGDATNVHGVPELTISSAESQFVESYSSKHQGHICFVTAEGKEVTTKETQWRPGYVDYEGVSVPCWSYSDDSGQYYTWRTEGSVESLTGSTRSEDKGKEKEKEKGKEKGKSKGKDKEKDKDKDKEKDKEKRKKAKGHKH